MDIFSLVTGMKGASGFGSSTTAEDVTQGIDATNITAIITGFLMRIFVHFIMFFVFSLINDVICF